MPDWAIFILVGDEMNMQEMLKKCPKKHVMSLQFSGESLLFFKDEQDGFHLFSSTHFQDHPTDSEIESWIEKRILVKDEEDLLQTTRTNQATEQINYLVNEQQFEHVNGLVPMLIYQKAIQEVRKAGERVLQEAIESDFAEHMTPLSYAFRVEGAFRQPAWATQMKLDLPLMESNVFYEEMKEMHEQLVDWFSDEL